MLQDFVAVTAALESAFAPERDMHQPSVHSGIFARLANGRAQAWEGGRANTDNHGLEIRDPVIKQEADSVTHCFMS